MYDILDEQPSLAPEPYTSYEPNETLAEAVPLGEGHHAINGNNIDWFELEMQAGPVEITMTPTGARDALNMVLFNAAGTAIRAGNTPTGPETISMTIATGGTYYVRVIDAQFGLNPPAGGIAFDYTLDIDLPQVVAPDGNNTQATATPLTEGSHDILGREVDWHRIEATEGYLTLTMTETQLLDDPADTRDDPRNLQLVLHDAAGNPLKQAPSTGTTESFTYLVPQDGTYYARVITAQFGNNAPDGTILSYNLTVDMSDPVTPDGNDTMATASPLTEGTHQITGTGQDWFSLVSPSGQISVTLTPDAATWPDGRPMDLNVVLVNAEGVALAASNGSGGPESISNYVLTADGTYYLRVVRADHPDGIENTTLDYSLTIDLPEVAASDGNDTQATAEVLPSGATSHIGTGVDWYRFDSLSGVVSLQLTETGTQPNGDPMRLNMVLYNAAGEQLGSASDLADVKTLSYLLGTDGTYFLKVFWAPFPDGAPNGVTLSYDLELTPPVAGVSDGNDTQATAEVLPAGATSHTGTGVDWYRFDSLSGLVSLQLTETGTQPNGDPMRLNMVLYNAAGEQLGSASDLAEVKNLSYLLGSDATYYLKVFWAPFPDGAPNGVAMSYDLNLALPVADVSDGNDTRATAELLTEGHFTETAGTGVDWYRFTSGPGQIDIVMTHTGTTAPDGRVLDMNMELYNAAGEIIRNGFETLADEDLTHYGQVSQTYFLKVYWAAYRDGAPNGVALNYELDVSLPHKTWSTELDFGPVRGAAISVYDIDRDGKDEILVGTSKKLDENSNEILPAGLIALEDDGTVKWSLVLPGFDGPDPYTGLTYTSSSVTTAPVFSDVNGDNRIDIIVGTGGDSRNESDGGSGQPGDVGGVHAINADGTLIWSFQTKDSFGSINGGPDGRPDGVYGSPLVFDIDADGKREVMFTSWDHYLYVLNGQTGALEFKVDLHDTAGATPALADLNNDGLYEIVVPADITDNPRAGIPTQGGLLHVLSNYGQANIIGWNDQIFDTTSPDFRGKWEEQSLWSSPQIVDLDRDGVVEIVQGTGNFFQDTRGQYVKVWNADGTLRMQLDTVGRVLASPLIADLNGDGSMEIIAATLEGHLHAWTAGGTELFDVTPRPWSDDIGGLVPDALTIGRKPIAVDLDNDGDLEILLSIGSQLVVVDSDGTQLTSTTRAEQVFNTYSGSPVAHDIDADGKLDLVSGGTDVGPNRAIIYRWENIVDVTSPTDYRTAAYQNMQSLHNVEAFVDRFYETILGRNADPGGRSVWTDQLATGVRTGADVAEGFIRSVEFTNRNTSDAEYLGVLYNAFFGRDAGPREIANWQARMDAGQTRDAVLEGFVGSTEFRNLAISYGIQARAAFGAFSDAAEIQGDPADTSLLRGGPGDNVLFDEGTGVAETNADEKLIAGQVYRMYGSALNRGPDAGGFISWFEALRDGRVTEEQVANRFANSTEFQNTYGTLTDAEFVALMYRNVLGREAGQQEIDNWVARMTRETDPMTKAQVLLGFSDSGEFIRRTNAALDDYMVQVNPVWVDVLEGGAGNDEMNGGAGSDIFVFRADQVGSDVIHGFEPWDRLQLSGFGFNTPADAQAHMTRVGSDVIFSHAGQEIRFLNTTLTEMQRVRYNLS